MWGIYVLIGIIILLLLISYYFIKDNKTLYAIENIKKYLEDPNNNHQMNYHFSKYLFIDREKRFPKNSLDALTNLLLRIEKDIQIIPIIILYPIETEQKIFSKKCDELATLLEESETYKNKPFFVFFYNPNNQQMSIKISIQATLKCLPISTYCQTLKKYAFKISRGTRAIEVFLYNNLIVVYIVGIFYQKHLSEVGRYSCNFMDSVLTTNFFQEIIKKFRCKQEELEKNMLKDFKMKEQDYLVV